jgi:hypothetical protein
MAQDMPPKGGYEAVQYKVGEFGDHTLSVGFGEI